MSATQSRREMFRHELMVLMQSISRENGYRNDVALVLTVPAWDLESSYPRISVVLGSGGSKVINGGRDIVTEAAIDVWLYGYFHTGGPAAIASDPNVDAGDSLMHDMQRALATKWRTQAGGSTVIEGNKWNMSSSLQEHRFYVPSENRGFVLLKGVVAIRAIDSDF